MSSHAQNALPRGSLSTNRYTPPEKPGQAKTRREYRDWLKRNGGFARPRLK